jgi:Fur family ferric uptake transcriptional regulator
MILNSNKDNRIKGLVFTTQRRLLLELLRDTGGHINAKELYKLAIAKDKSISQATVYRSLKLFKELGLIDERRFGTGLCYYELKQSPEHQHLVCQGCGKIIEFQNPHFHELVKEVQREHRFKVSKADLYLEGYCGECEDKQEIQPVTKFTL